MYRSVNHDMDKTMLHNLLYHLKVHIQDECILLTLQAILDFLLYPHLFQDVLIHLNQLLLHYQFHLELTQDEIDSARAVDLSELKHPEKDEDRAKNPEWLVMLGVCTHLGCVPLNDKGDYGAWFCPCHGSHYDTSGRIRKGPAPTNMEVPKYEFVNSNTIKIG